MEAAGIVLRGLALVVEKEEGPRMVFRYDPTPGVARGALFTALRPTDFAKLFCAKRALRGGLVELQLEDTLFVSCPTGDAAPAADAPAPVFWGDAEGGDDDGGDGDGGGGYGGSRLKFFDVVWAATGARDGEAGVRLERLEAVARDVSAALRHEERRCGYVSRECAAMLAAAADVHEDDARRTRAQARASPLARELVDLFDGAVAGGVRVRFNRWIAVCGRLARRAAAAGDGGEGDDAESDGEAASSAATSDDPDVTDDGLDASQRSFDVFDASIVDAGTDPALAAARRARRDRRRRTYAPYETLLLLDGAAELGDALPASVTWLAGAETNH